jgi:hypothetical protein
MASSWMGRPEMGTVVALEASSIEERSLVAAFQFQLGLLLL